jgi:hypothetical protein
MAMQVGLQLAKARQYLEEVSDDMARQMHPAIAGARCGFHALPGLACRVQVTAVLACTAGMVLWFGRTPGCCLVSLTFCVSA